jgi:pantoate--beta-alanine ligase
MDGRMEIIDTVKQMQDYAESHRRAGRKISFVPTMGYFHDGHLNLMRVGKKMGDRLVISIYVNPTQFGPNEDLSRYPRDFERDRQLAGDVGVDVIFYPPDREMYPPHYQTYVNVEEVTHNLCGLSRPVHFRGVATICCKLFNMVKPHIAVFGKKDFQQLVVIKRMVQDLNMDLTIEAMATTREPDGLAMSSRNVYLKPEERESALSLNRSLRMAAEMYGKGERDAGKIIRDISGYISKHPHARIDYVKICDTETMQDIEKLDRESVMALAVFIGTTRLIDNHVFGEALER